MSRVRQLAALVGEREPLCGGTRVVCVDGPAGSGKTTLATRLSAELGGAPVVHLDDLYEGWHQELGAPLAARLTAWLLDPWTRGAPGRFPRYDWAADAFTAEWVEVPAAPTVILEGCGSASSGVRARASLVVWIEAEPRVRMARGIQRDGEHLAGQWRDWQCREAEHFAADGTREAADVVLTT